MSDDPRYPPSWRVFLTAVWDMARMVALPVAAVAVFVGVLINWPGPFIGLAILLVLGWLLDRRANRISREHHW